MDDNAQTVARSALAINLIEGSLLQDLLNLYGDDFARSGHSPEHFECLACAKQSIVEAISKYRDLQLQTREHA